MLSEVWRETGSDSAVDGVVGIAIVDSRSAVDTADSSSVSEDGKARVLGRDGSRLRDGIETIDRDATAPPKEVDENDGRTISSDLDVTGKPIEMERMDGEILATVADRIPLGRSMLGKATTAADVVVGASEPADADTKLSDGTLVSSEIEGIGKNRDMVVGSVSPVSTLDVIRSGPATLGTALCIADQEVGIEISGATPLERLGNFNVEAGELKGEISVTEDWSNNEPPEEGGESTGITAVDVLIADTTSDIRILPALDAVVTFAATVGEEIASVCEATETTSSVVSSVALTKTPIEPLADTATPLVSIVRPSAVFALKDTVALTGNVGS